MEGVREIGPRPESLDQENFERTVRKWHLPGESVKVDPKGVLPGSPVEGYDVDFDVSRLPSGSLKVARTTIHWSKDPNYGMYVAAYAFKGIEGEFAAVRFTDGRPLLHFYGALVERDGNAYAVELSSDGSATVVGEPYPLVPDLTRLGREAFGGLEPVQALEMLTSEGGATGEFIIRQREDGCWHLDGCPWSSSITEAEKASVEKALADREAEVVASFR